MPKIVVKITLEGVLAKAFEEARSGLSQDRAAFVKQAVLNELWRLKLLPPKFYKVVEAAMSRRGGV